MSFEFTHQSSPLLKNPVMESSSLHKISFSSLGGVKLRTPLKKKPSSSLQVHAFSYRSFVNSAIEETQRHIQLVPSPLQEQFNCVKSMDGKAELKMLAFQAPKIKLLRSLTIEGSDAMQPVVNPRELCSDNKQIKLTLQVLTTQKFTLCVLGRLLINIICVHAVPTYVFKILDFAVFPEPEYDLPIFCANFFTAASMNIIVLDFNPLHDVIIHKDYKEKYYSNLMPLAVRYAELLPWGGKLTSESMRFFSPIVIWTRFTSSQYEHDTLYSAFMDYYKAWLELMDYAVEEKDVSKINLNREAQHRYLTWRAEKDPGYHVLRRLIGENDAEDIVRSFLFSGVHTLGNKSFLDYFPEYRCEDGTINKKRSMMGKSFETRPWDTGGEFIGNGAR